MNDPHEDDTGREQQLNEALAAYFRCLDRSEFVDRHQFAQQYPQLAPDLQQLLEAAFLVEHMAGAEETSSDSGDRHHNQPESHQTTSEPPWLAETAVFEQAVAARAADASNTSLPTRLFGDYEILERIGRGGMGVVYKARQKGLDRLVAVKMIRAAELASDADVERFLAEAHAAGRLGHPNIVQVHQVGAVKGQYFYSMEFVDGADLAHMARSETSALEPKRIARYVRDVARAIQYAHEHNIVHRDLKPANVIIDAHNDRPLVTDFGLAKDISQDQGLTASGAFIGTPSYMSPEQASGTANAVGPASDIYSLGTILYELLTRRPPFLASSTIETLLNVMHKEPTAPHVIDEHVDRQLEAVCLKCLRKEPDQRYATAQQLADDLTRYLNDEPVLAQQKRLHVRCWHWLRNIPLVAAIVGRRVAHPDLSHLCAQWGLIIGGISLLAVVTLVMNGGGAGRPFPKQVRIAAGRPQWEYDQFAESLGAVLRNRVTVPVEVLNTEGAVENRELLGLGHAEVALMQAGTISSDDLAVVAPVYEEYIHFVVRVDRNIATVKELSNRNVVVGLNKSGMRVAAERILEKLQLPIIPVHADFGLMQDKPDWDAAIITTGSENPELRRILLDARFALLSLSPNETELLSGPEFQRHVIQKGLFAPGQDTAGHDGVRPVPDKDIHTLTTITLLVVQKTASSKFVEILLDTLYGDPLLGQTYNLIPVEEAAEWQFFPLHPAAREFFNDSSVAASARAKIRHPSSP